MRCLRSGLQCVSRLRSFHCHQIRSKREKHLPFAARFAGNIGPRSNSPDTGYSLLLSEQPLLIHVGAPISPARTERSSAFVKRSSVAPTGFKSVNRDLSQDSVAKFGQSECSHHASRFRLRRCEPFDATNQCSNTGSLAATQTQEIGSQPHSCTSASTIIVIPVLHNTCTYGQVWKILGS
jgi:hypothetical protein